MIGQPEHVGELVAGVKRLDRVRAEIGGCLTQWVVAVKTRPLESGSSTPGRYGYRPSARFRDPTLTPAPSIASPSIRQWSPTCASGPMMLRLIRERSPIRAPSSNTELSTCAPGPSVTPAPSTVRPATVAPAEIVQPGPITAGACTEPPAPARRRRRRRSRRPRARRPTRPAPADLGHDLSVEDVVGRLQIPSRRADVHPVSGCLVAEQAVIDKPREDIALDRDPGARRSHLGEHRALEHVHPGIDQVGVDLVGVRLLQKARHRQIVAPADEPVRRGILDGDQRDRRARARLLMLAQQRGQVDVGQLIAVEHQEPVVQQLLGELQRAAGSERSGSST